LSSHRLRRLPRRDQAPGAGRFSAARGPLAPHIRRVGPDGLIGHESLLDNEDWSPGREAIIAWPWPRLSKPYALRQFTVLLPGV
jgi:hypothetical protein